MFIIFNFLIITILILFYLFIPVSDWLLRDCSSEIDNGDKNTVKSNLLHNGYLLGSVEGLYWSVSQLYLKLQENIHIFSKSEDHIFIDFETK